MSSEETRTSQPGRGLKVISAAGEGHHAQAGQPTSPSLAPLYNCFSFFPSCEQSPVPELSSLAPYGWAESQGRGSRSGLGSVVSSPNSQGSSGSTGALHSVSGPLHPVQLCPKCHPCPQLSHGRVSQHGSPGMKRVRGKRLGLRKLLVLQPSCPGVRSCAGTALSTHTELILHVNLSSG